MSIASALTLTTGFNVTPELFAYTDTTDYAAEGIALADVIGIITVVAPDGVTWHQGYFSNPDIEPALSLTNDVIPIPTDANGAIQAGDYTITYTIQVSGGVQPGTYSKTYTVNYCQASPNPLLSTSVDVFCGIVGATDITSYTTTLGTWAVSSRTITLTNAYNLAIPQNTSGPGPTVQVTSNIYPGTWKATLNVTVTITVSGVTYTEDLIYTVDFQVADFGLCSIYCCVKTLWNRYITAYNAGNTSLAAETWAQLEFFTTARGLITDAYDCGQQADAQTIIQQIQTRLNCTGNCNCGDTPTPIVPICGSGGNVAYSFLGSGGIATPVVVGGTVNYSLTQTNQDILANVYNTTVSQGSSAVVVTPAAPVPGNPPTVDYEVDLSATTKGALQEQYSALLTITFPGLVPTYALSRQVIHGVNFQAPTITAVTPGTVANPNRFIIDRFETGSSTHIWKAKIEVADLAFNDPTTQTSWISGRVGLALIPQIKNIAADSFELNLNTITGTNPSLGVQTTSSWLAIMANLSSIKLFVTIYE